MTASDRLRALLLSAAVAAWTGRHGGVTAPTFMPELEAIVDAQVQAVALDTDMVADELIALKARAGLAACEAAGGHLWDGYNATEDLGTGRKTRIEWCVRDDCPEERRTPGWLEVPVTENDQPMSTGDSTLETT